VRTSDLERRLIEWADEYGGGRYDHIGWPGSSSVAVLMTYHGRAPQGLHQRAIIGTAADQVEDIVRSLAKQTGGRTCAAILRTEYWMRSAALEHKLERLRIKDGIHVTENDYQRLMVAARDYVGNALLWTDDTASPPEAVKP
jgi:hypothetical protein